jgi:hypothetical protein
MDRQHLIPAHAADDGEIIDVSNPTNAQLQAWSNLGKRDANELEQQAAKLERDAERLVQYAKRARRYAATLRACVADKTILPTDKMCRVCVAEEARAGWGAVMTNCLHCGTRPIHNLPQVPYNHRPTIWDGKN